MATLYSPGLCRCWVLLWSCFADFARIQHSDNYQPRCDATPPLLCPNTPLKNVLTPGGGWVSGLGESAFRRLTVCRTSGTLEDPGLRQAPLWGPLHPFSVCPAGGASQCSSGTRHSHPPAPGQSTGSAAGRTGTPLLQETEKKRKKKRRCCDNKQTPCYYRGSHIFLSTCLHHTLRVGALKFRSSHHHQAQCPSQCLPQNFHNSGQDVTWGGGRGCYRRAKSTQLVQCHNITIVCLLRFNVLAVLIRVSDFSWRQALPLTGLWIHVSSSQKKT